MEEAAKEGHWVILQVQLKETHFLMLEWGESEKEISMTVPVEYATVIELWLCVSISLQNIHLVARWLGALEKLLERCCEDSHPDYRVFMSAEPASTAQEHIIPQVKIQQACKKSHTLSHFNTLM